MDSATQALLDAALAVYRRHERDERGRCPECVVESGVDSVDGRGDCGSRRGAAAVLAVLGYEGGTPFSRAELAAGRAALRALPPGGSVLVPGPVARREAERLYEAELRRSVPVNAQTHPAWCAGPPLCRAGDGQGHVGRPVQVGYTTAMLADAGSGLPMIGLIDQDGEICVPATHADTLADVLHELCETAAHAN